MGTEYRRVPGGSSQNVLIPFSFMRYDFLNNLANQGIRGHIQTPSEVLQHSRCSRYIRFFRRRRRACSGVKHSAILIS
jgi:hypothetical protein